MLHRVAGAVNARTLAVPEAKDAIDGFGRVGLDLLGSVNGGGRQIFVDGGQELDLVLAKIVPGPPELLVVSTQRGPTVAADETRCVQAGGTIKRALHQWKLDQRLGPGQVDPT